ncbi:unnamed protein product [Diamesa hyperborea]
MKTSEVFSKRKTCRTCLKLHESSSELVSIFETEKFIVPPNTSSIKFSEMLSTISNHLCSMDDFLPKHICLTCVNAIRSAYCFKVQSERSYKTLKEQFGSGYTNIKIEHCDHVPEHSIDQEQPDQMEIDTETIPEVRNIELPPKIIDNIDRIKLEPEEQEELLVEITDVLPMTQELLDFNASNNYTNNENDDDDSNSDNIYDQPDSELESISDDKDSEKNVNDDKQSASGTSATDSGTCTNAEEPDLLTHQELIKLKCQVCLKQLFSAGSLKRHKKIHATMCCNFCRRKFATTSTLKCHIKCIHPDKYHHFQLNGQIKAVVSLPLLNIPKCSSCNLMFCSIEALYKHHAECDHKCIECNTVYLRKDSYFKHLEKEHGIHLNLDYVECQFCSHKFLTARGLREHITRLHSEPTDLLSSGSTLNKIELPSPVSSPSKSPSNKSTIKNELTRTEFVEKFLKLYQGDLWNCTLCDLKLVKRSIPRHLLFHHVVLKPFKCPFCSIRFPSSEMRLRHLNNDHPDGYKCETCMTVYEYGDSYLEHMLFIHGIVVDLPANEEEADIENDQLRYSCEELDSSSTKDQFIERYMKNVSTETLLCLPCKKNISKTGINFHLSRYHATEMAFKCAFCIRRFTRTEYRSKHMKISHPTDYYCFACNVQYPHHIMYSEHMRTSHSFNLTTKPEPGEEDDISFNDLRFVPVLTTENKNYHETDCSIPKITKKALKLKNDQDEAVKLNDVNKPMKKDEFVQLYFTKDDKSVTCKICSTTFNCGLLGSHLKRWHSTTMPYNCLICNEGFYRTDALMTHMSKVHPKDLNCDFCNLQFTRTHLYVDHMKVKHDVKAEIPTNIEPVSANILNLLFVVKPARISLKEMFKIKVRSRSQVTPLKKSLPSTSTSSTATITASTSTATTPASTSTATIQASTSTATTPSTNKIVYTKEEFLRKFTKNTKTKGTAFCIPCKKKIVRKNLFHHMKTKHSEQRSYKCGLCEFDFTSTKSRLAHMNRVHYHDYRCKYCNRQFVASALYAHHMKHDHDETVPDSVVTDKVLDLPVDKLMFIEQSKLFKRNKKKDLFYSEMDEEIEDPEEDVTVEDTPNEVLQEEVIAVTAREATPEEVQVVTSRESTPEVIILQTSLNSSTNCVECNEEFESSRSYRFHMRVHHIKTEDDPIQIKTETEQEEKVVVKIKQEQKKFHTTEKNFMIHVNVRHNATDNPNFICGVCGDGHDNEDELIRHFKTHNGNSHAQVVVKEDTDEERSDNDSPYCKICKLSFKFKIIQNIHNNMWHNESNPNRNLTHLAQESLKKEQETDIKFIKCELCDEPFIRPDDLEEHLKTKHLDQDSSGEDKPLIIDETTPNTSKTDFNCDQCILNFPCEQYLTNHKRFFCKSSPKVIINVSENQNTLNEQ